MLQQALKLGIHSIGKVADYSGICGSNAMPIHGFEEGQQWADDAPKQLQQVAAVVVRRAANGLRQLHPYNTRPPCSFFQLQQSQHGTASFSSRHWE